MIHDYDTDQLIRDSSFHRVMVKFVISSAESNCYHHLNMFFGVDVLVNLGILPTANQFQNETSLSQHNAS